MIKSKYGLIMLLDKEGQKKQRIEKLKKTIYTFGTAIDDHRPGLVPWLFTLTYKDVDGYKKNHLRDFIKIVRSHLYRRGYECIYCWVAEHQKRGAIHYHIIFWLPPLFSLPKVGRCGWWKYGFTDQKIAKKSIGYLLKYVSKGSNHDYMKGQRIYGVGGNVVEAKRKVRFYRASKCIRDEIIKSGKDYYDVDIRKVKGGRVCNLSGIFWQSNWRFQMFGKGKKMIMCFYKVEKDRMDYHLGIFIDINKNLDIMLSQKCKNKV